MHLSNVFCAGSFNESTALSMLAMSLFDDSNGMAR